MLIKIELDLPQHDSEQVNVYAQCERQEALEGLCASYGYPSALVTSEGVELVPENIVSNYVKGSKPWRNDIQMSVGGLVLELMASEKEWNSPDRWERVEQAVESNNFVE
jgi:hypothetical protein